MIKKSSEKTALSAWTIISLLILGSAVLVFSYFDIHKKWTNIYQNGQLKKAIVIKIEKGIGNKTVRSDCCFYTYNVNNEDFNFKICDCVLKIGDSLIVKYNPRKVVEHEVVIE
jgi:hypothetical protein